MTFWRSFSSPWDKGDHFGTSDKPEDLTSDRAGVSRHFAMIRSRLSEWRGVSGAISFPFASAQRVQPVATVSHTIFAWTHGPPMLPIRTLDALSTGSVLGSRRTGAALHVPPPCYVLTEVLGSAPRAIRQVRPAPGFSRPLIWCGNCRPTRSPNFPLATRSAARGIRQTHSDQWACADRGRSGWCHWCWAGPSGSDRSGSRRGRGPRAPTRNSRKTRCSG